MIYLKKNNTWEFIGKPKKKKIFSCKWLYPKGEIPRVEEPKFKAKQACSEGVHKRK